MFHHIPIHVAAMVILMRVIGRKGVDQDLLKACITFSLTFVGLQLAASSIGVYGLALYFVIPFVLLGTIFYASLPKAAIIAACFSVYLVAFGLVVEWIGF